MKNRIKYFLQQLFGYELYLFAFAIFKIKTLKNDSKEKDFFYFLNLIPRSDGAILDIGANLGIMTFFLSKKFSKNKIYAIEPVPSNLVVLEKIIKKFRLSNVIVFNIALGAEKNTATMILPNNQGTKMQGLSHIKHQSMELWNEGEEFEVEMNTLDLLFAGQEIKAIKMDVENFEYFVLKGGQQLLIDNKPLIYMELWDNENRIFCMNFLKSMNYDCFVIENNQCVQFQLGKHKQQNFLFIAKN